MTLPTTLGIRIAWKNQNDFEQGFRIYRSETDFDESNLPPVLAEVPPGTEVYVDETANPEGTYYYLVSTFYKAKEVFAIATVKAKAYAGPLTLGEFYQGGYYIGNIVVADGGEDDGTYAIMMAGLDGQSPTTLRWKTTTTSTLNTDSLTNGYANTQAMIAAGIASHPAAEFCVNYDGGAFTDWYLPSKDELNLAWVNRTSLAGLAMTAENFWSSSQTSASYAWYQHFSNGTQRNYSKTYAYRVRPVRRLKLML